MNLLLAALILGGVFGSASATVESIDSNVMMLDLTVEVIGGADTVVAHLIFEDEELFTLPMLDRGDGVFGSRTELEPKNYAVIFEVVGEEPSGAVLLTQLGADLGPESGEAPAEDDEGLSAESQSLLWLAIALGAASLSVLAFWVLGGRDRKDDEEGEGESVPDIEDQPVSEDPTDDDQ